LAIFLESHRHPTGQEDKLAHIVVIFVIILRLRLHLGLQLKTRETSQLRTIGMVDRRHIFTKSV
jgi:hypothetical protein